MRRRLREKLERRRLRRRFDALYLYVWRQLPAERTPAEKAVITDCILYKADFECYRLNGSPLLNIEWRKGPSHPIPFLPNRRRARREARHA